MPLSPEPIHTTLAENVARVRARIAESCRRSGRDPADVRLVAVTKYVNPELIEALRGAGVADIGESRVQQLVQRSQRLAGGPGDFDQADGQSGLVWHMIGHLQRNKVKPLIPRARVIHSLDSSRLAHAIQKRAAELGVSVDVFVEVNVAGEDRKTGVGLDQVANLAEIVEELGNLRLRGLMTMAPFVADPEQARPQFAGLRDLLESLRRGGGVSPICRQLSMGMSGDYAVAVEEGATVVRIGSALFEGLQECGVQRERVG